MIVRPAKRILGRLELPGDKSISHRAAMFAALANGTSRITNFSTSEDCAATLRCLGELGVSITRENNDVVVQGVGMQGLREPSRPLDCGNSGTTMRLLAGILAGQPFETTLTGDESLRSRPMQRIIEPLEMMGAEIESNNGRAPLTIRGRHPLHPIIYELSVASAQVKSSILLAGLSANGHTTVTERFPTRDHTERLLCWFAEEGEGIGSWELWKSAVISGPANLAARDIDIPGDISSAAYFIAAAALLEGASLEITNVGLNPRRIAFLKVMESAGFDIDFDRQREQSHEPVGYIRVEGGGKSARPSLPGKPPDHDLPPIFSGLTSCDQIPIGGSVVAELIDELPLLAMVGSQLESGIEIREASELRVKETDRIAATVAGLRAMGAEVEEFEDGLRVNGPTRLRGARIDSRGDHRIAMTFAIAGLIAEGETEITDPECVRVSFPEFFDLLDSVVER